jgi:hypothetical protein
MLASNPSKEWPAGIHVRTMRKSVIFPARSFARVRGRSAGGGMVPSQGLILTLKPPRTR